MNEHQWGVDGHKGIVADMQTLGIWEPLAVKLQTIKTAIEVRRLILDREKTICDNAS